MPCEYEVSAALLSEIWSALRAPVMPWELSRAGGAIKELAVRASHLGREDLHTCLESILFRAAHFEFSSSARAELIRVLGMPPDLEGPAHPAAVPEPSLASIAAFCMKLEMFGFGIDSAQVCGAARAEPRLRGKQGKAAALYEMDVLRMGERLKKRVIVRAKGRLAHSSVRTLRTHTGFIIQPYLGRDLEPVRLDVFGPKYNGVGDWMGLLKGDAAWSLELRDAPGYNPDSPLEAATFPRRAASGRKSS